MDVTVPGAVIGDFVTASFSLNTTGVLVGGYVGLADTVRLQLTNPTGADITLPAGTVFSAGQQEALTSIHPAYGGGA